MKAYLPACLLLSLAACGQEAPRPVESSPPAATIKQDIPRPDGAEAAHKLVDEYLGYIAERDYAKALTAWSERGQKAFLGDPSYLEKQQPRYARIRGSAAPLAEVYGGTDPANIVVPITAKVTLRADGSEHQTTGLVYLNRSAPGADWKITGVDIRKPGKD